MYLCSNGGDDVHSILCSTFIGLKISMDFKKMVVAKRCSPLDSKLSSYVFSWVELMTSD